MPCKNESDILLFVGPQCEHHLLPFYGIAHIACIMGPRGHPLTSAKAEQIVALYSRRLQIQVCRIQHKPPADSAYMTVLVR